MFKMVTVSDSEFPAGPDVVITDRSEEMRLMLYNKHSTAIVEFSHNGDDVSDGGELDPADATKGQTFDVYKFRSIWFRLKAGSTGPAKVYVKAWAP